MCVGVSSVPTCGVSGENKKRGEEVGGVCVWGGRWWGRGGGAMNLIYFLSPCPPPPLLPSDLLRMEPSEYCTRQGIHWSHNFQSSPNLNSLVVFCLETMGGLLSLPIRVGKQAASSFLIGVLIRILFCGTVWRIHSPSFLPLWMIMDFLHSLLYLFYIS